ncbi:hypothetical protein [Gimibacter soli]|uniref:Uncharacterized protein n=1 Tax=Gimibacter soli TaxID=3024400 RepID=A0AAF0BIT1_9PROT|nr:hypothetical protein [Gimibacter soli]WCL55768.1 hypothetical protein PH603_08365 [Gimibacter soli]
MPERSVSNTSLPQVSTLSTLPSGAAERFVLHVTRQWVGALTAEAGSARLARHIDAWHRAFCVAGGPMASRHWDQFMGLVARRSARKVNVKCCACQQMTMDERRIIAAAGAYQNAQVERGRTILGHWFKGDGMALAEHALILFVDHLSGSGYRLSPPTDHETRSLTIAVLADNTGVTIH